MILYDVVASWTATDDDVELFYSRTRTFRSDDEARLCRARLQQGAGVPARATDVEVTLTERRVRAA
jgi:hypothetical protein